MAGDLGGGLDRALLSWDHRVRHEIRVGAPPERGLAAVRDVRAAEMPLVRLLWLQAAKRAAEQPAH